MQFDKATIFYLKREVWIQIIRSMKWLSLNSVQRKLLIPLLSFEEIIIIETLHAKLGITGVSLWPLSYLVFGGEPERVIQSSEANSSLIG